MMEKVNKYISGELNPEEEEQLLQQLFEAKKNEDLKRNWAKKLEDKHGSSKLKKGNKVTRKINPKIRRIFWGIAAIGLLLLAVIFLLPSREVSLQASADRYLQGAPFPNANTYRGLENENDLRASANTAYNLQDYPKAIENFQSLLLSKEAQEADYLYLGLSQLYNQDFTASSQTLDTGLKLSAQLENPDFLQEFRWYAALSLLKSGQEEEALRLLQNIQEGDWQYDAAQSLLNQN